MTEHLVRQVNSLASEKERNEAWNKQVKKENQNPRLGSEITRWQVITMETDTPTTIEPR